MGKTNNKTPTGARIQGFREDRIRAEMLRRMRRETGALSTGEIESFIWRLEDSLFVRVSVLYPESRGWLSAGFVSSAPAQDLGQTS